MTTLTLDPDPDNQLGKGMFAPDKEAKLLAAGYVFAMRLPKLAHVPFSVMVVCQRLIADAATDMAMDNPRIANRRLRPEASPQPQPYQVLNSL